MNLAFDASRLDAVRSIHIHWADDYVHPTPYLVPDCDVAAFVEATVALHGSPGRNPHNGAQTRRVVEIQAVTLVVTGPYWWTTPGLHAQPGVGARVIAAHGERSILWQCPRFQAELAASSTPPIEAQ